jgi:sugar lactone lactonase YvrE
MTSSKLEPRIVAVVILISLVRFASAQLYVSNYGGANGGSVGKYDAMTGAPIDASFISGIGAATGLALDGEGHLLVAFGSGVHEYDANTGAVINASFITGLAGNPNGIALDGIGNLYVADYSGTIGKYNALTGAPINAAFISTAHPFGLAVDANRRLYASNFSLSSVLVFDAGNGAVIANPLLDVTDMMSDPVGLAVDSTGHLFVGNYASGVVNEFDATTGAVINSSLVTVAGAIWGIALDGSGSLFVVDVGGAVRKYDAATGAPVAGFTLTGLDAPQFIAIVPEPAGISLGLLAMGGVLLRRGRRGK